MSVYKIKKIYSISFSLVFIASTVAGIDITLGGKSIGILAVIASTSMFCLFCNPNRYRFCVLPDKLVKRVLKKEESCNWEWIYSITTEKNSTTGGYFTVVHWTKFSKLEMEDYLSRSNKCNENIGKIFITSHIAGYRELLNEIVDKSINATLDQTTSTLVQAR